jgi:hypothetical protein
MASNVIDYFSTLGRKSLVCKSFESLWADDKAKSPSEIWNEAITDIAVVHSGERLPDSSWQIIDRSIDNRPIMSRNGLIAVRRRSASKRLDHITKVMPSYFEKLKVVLNLIQYHRIQHLSFKLFTDKVDQERGCDTLWLRIN